MKQSLGGIWNYQPPEHTVLKESETIHIYEGLPPSGEMELPKLTARRGLRTLTASCALLALSGLICGQGNESFSSLRGATTIRMFASTAFI